MVNIKGADQRFKRGILKNEKGNQITIFNTNNFGLASFTFTPDLKKTYSVEITLANGQKIQQKLPPIEEKGIVLKVQNTPGAKKYLFV